MKIKKSEKCDKCMEEYLMLEKGQRVPARLTWHFLTCKECRTNVKLLVKAEKACEQTASQQTDINNQTIQNILKQLNMATVAKKSKRFSMAPWIIGAIVLIASFICYFMMKTSATSKLSIYTYIVFAMIIAAYCAAFIAGNIELFIKKFDFLENI
ncbi:MAG: hypothetical protein SPI86_00745 [Treponemataceae bacterium]|nr:hypothetical protein [Spirochaetales bacterium]MDY6030266.1 hypothetical protein [Treponemataceae bacterium]